VSASKSNEILYFKDCSGQFLISEVRSLAVTATPVEDIIAELKKGPRNGSEMTAILPKTMTLDEYCFQQDAGGNETLILRLSCPHYETMDNPSLLLLLASLVESLCGRLPQVAGIQIYLNGVLQGNIPGVGTVSGGLLTSDLFNGLIGQIVTLYLRKPGESLLVQVKRAMSQEESSQARYRIYELMKGPLTASDAAAIFPDGVTQDDLLGVWVDSECMYINFSQNLQDLCRTGNVDERALVYGIVNTMVDFYNVRQVQILIEGKRVKSLAGLIVVEAPLLPNPGIVTG
jgi:spore germination protein GerM